MARAIDLIPEVPREIIEAAQIGTLIPFIGSGVSRLAGCPDWDEFANSALKFLGSHGRFSHAQLDQVKELPPRVRLSIALAVSNQVGINIPFDELLHQKHWEKNHDGRKIYSFLSRLGKTFVTTNYDKWLDNEISYPSPELDRDDPGSILDSVITPRESYYRTEELTADNLNRANVVIHLHGSVKDPSSMIMTTPDYVSHYANDRRVNDRDPENKVLTLLEHLFEHKTVLFVGYGLNELEILEYIIGKARTKGGNRLISKPKHFLLHGFFSHEEELMVSMRTYYAQCGIGLLPFLRDQKDWRQLFDVLELFGNKAPASNMPMVQKFKVMETLLNG